VAVKTLREIRSYTCTLRSLLQLDAMEGRFNISNGHLNWIRNEVDDLVFIKVVLALRPHTLSFTNQDQLRRSSEAHSRAEYEGSRSSAS
jgi:hypothetical protein